MIRRMHFFAGLIVGPFILVAALSGALYALAPQLETMVYSHELHAGSSEQKLTLDDQVRRAVEHVRHEAKDAEPPALVAVRPAPEPGETARVLFAPPEGSNESAQRAVFVSPSDGEIRGDLITYGSSGALPLRTWIDQLHRDLHLGEPGRLYSEFAASWMWVIAVGGLILWVPQLTRRLRAGYSRRRALRESALPLPDARGRNRLLSWHYSAGLGLMLAMVFLSATGITWSAHAGEHVTDLRAALNWSTPKPSTSLSGEQTPADEHAGHTGHGGHGGHAGHGGHSGHAGHGGHAGAPAGETDASRPVDSGHDAILRAARRFGIDSNRVEIVPSASKDAAWTVQEVDRHYPTEVDSVTIDPMTYNQVDRVSFHDDYSLPAKLARWGVDIHMGLWFGLINQLVLFVTGYWMWFKRRPRWSRPKTPAPGLRHAPWWGWLAVGVPAAAVGWFLPLVGIPLVAFVVADAVLAILGSRTSGGSGGAHRGRAAQP